MSLPVNQIVVGDCTEVMRGWPADSIDLVVTSPPYWGLRDYGTETVRLWGGDSECEHEWGKLQPPIHKGQVQQSKDEQGIRPSSSEGGNAPTGQFCQLCRAWRGSLGLESHPQQFIDHLVEICRGIKRVLKPSGTFWLNLGDTYYGGPPEHQPKDAKNLKRKAYSQKICERCGTPFLGDPKRRFCSAACGGSLNRKRVGWLQPKQKLMIPSRVAIALQHDGWILRSDIIWHKPNHMPSSVKDRLTCAYEHVFLFAKARRYYFDLDAIRKPHQTSPIRKTLPTDEYGKGLDYQQVTQGWRSGKALAYSYRNGIPGNPKGKNPGDLWRIPTTPFPGAHFATFPPKLIEPIVKAGSPRWICTKCGKPRERIRLISRPTYPSKEDPTLETGRAGFNRYREGISHKRLNIGQRKIAEKLRELAKNRFIEMRKCFGSKWDHWIRTDDSGARIPMPDDWTELKRIFPSLEIFDRYIISEPTEGWSDCGCDAGWTPGVVLDPFGGSGTVGQVARRLGRSFILIEIISEYCKMAEQRVRGRYKPTPTGVAPLDLFMETEK